MITLRPPLPEDADLLFPLVYRTPVTDTLLWDGPESLEAYRTVMADKCQAVARGEIHFFTIVETASGRPVGSADIRLTEGDFRADLGLWIGEPFHGKGYGARVARLLVNYGFGRLGLEKIEANVYTGNPASRHIFEKNGFLLEATIRKATRKRGVLQDDWMLGITREDWIASLLAHICPPAHWQAAQSAGVYTAASLGEVGFIHLSRPAQVLTVANRFYSQSGDLLVLWLDPGLFESPLRWEPADGDTFPHLYGPLNLTAVVMAAPFPHQPDQPFNRLPDR